MTLIKWDKSYSVGIEMLDAQHKNLFKLLDTMFEAMKEGKGKEVLGLVLGELKCYTITHFADEERMMKKHNFPGLKAHIFEHKLFIDKIKELTAKYQAGGIIYTGDITSFLKKWLVSHIQKMDKQYSNCLIGKGEK